MVQRVIQDGISIKITLGGSGRLSDARLCTLPRKTCLGPLYKLANICTRPIHTRMSRYRFSTRSIISTDHTCVTPGVALLAQNANYRYYYRTVP